MTNVPASHGQWPGFQIEEMNEAIIEGLKLGPRDESLLELSRITGHVIQSEDKQEPTQYECEAP
jgi:hypothetical protein